MFLIFFVAGIVGVVIAMYVQKLMKAAEARRDDIREETIENARFRREIEVKTGVSPAWPEDEQFAKMNRKRNDGRN